MIEKINKNYKGFDKYITGKNKAEIKIRRNQICYK